MITEIDSTCSYMQTIIQLPEKESVFFELQTPKPVIYNIQKYLKITEDIIDIFNDFPEICNYLREIVCKNEVYYVKTYPTEDAFQTDEIQHFLCYGKYSRNNSIHDHCIFFRIDQDFKEFTYPSYIKEKNKKIISYLSGTVSARPDFPSTILELRELNNPKLLGIEVLEGLFLLSMDYFGKRIYLNHNNIIEEFSKGKLCNTKLTIENWVNIEMYKLFKEIS